MRVNSWNNKRAKLNITDVNLKKSISGSKYFIGLLENQFYYNEDMLTPLAFEEFDHYLNFEKYDHFTHYSVAGRYKIDYKYHPKLLKTFSVDELDYIMKDLAPSKGCDDPLLVDGFLLSGGRYNCEVFTDNENDQAAICSLSGYYYNKEEFWKCYIRGDFN